MSDEIDHINKTNNPVVCVFLYSFPNVLVPYSCKDPWMMPTRLRERYPESDVQLRFVPYLQVLRLLQQSGCTSTIVTDWLMSSDMDACSDMDAWFCILSFMYTDWWYGRVKQLKTCHDHGSLRLGLTTPHKHSMVLGATPPSGPVPKVEIIAGRGIKQVGKAWDFAYTVLCRECRWQFSTTNVHDSKLPCSFVSFFQIERDCYGMLSLNKGVANKWFQAYQVVWGAALFAEAALCRRNYFIVF